MSEDTTETPQPKSRIDSLAKPLPDTRSLSDIIRDIRDQRERHPAWTSMVVTAKDLLALCDELERLEKQ